MKRMAIIAAAIAALMSANAQRSPDLSMAGSVSGQFFISARDSFLSPQSLKLAAAPGMVSLQPPLAVISCERIKQELLRELRLRDEWRGKIFVVLQPARSSDDPVVVAPEWFAGNWNCGVQLPAVVDQERFVEAIVRACLLEIANRNAHGRSTEIPEWLAQGFAAQLLGSSGEEIILQPPRLGKNGFSVTRLGMDLTDNPKSSGPNFRRLNPLADAIAVMQTNQPLTFDELSWPTDEQLQGGSRTMYRSSAQLFVNELLRLRDGPACLSAMLAELPNYLNWQLAFLDAFKNFQSSLDVEKWWALQVVQFTGRDMLHLLSPEESWNELDDLFHLPIDVKIGPAPPMRTEINFQTVIHGWSRARQLQMLKKKLWELDLLRTRISPEFTPLVDDYRQVLQAYYQKRSSGARNIPQYGPLVDKIEDEAIQKLDALDAKRVAMHPQAQMPVASAVAPDDVIAP